VAGARVQRIHPPAASRGALRVILMAVRGSHACILAAVMAMSLPAPAVNGVMSFGAGGMLGNAQFSGGPGGVAGAVGGPEVCTLRGEVDAECGCLLESSCTHGSAGVAAARSQFLKMLDQDHADDLAFIRTLRLPGALSSAERATAVARSTCGREREVHLRRRAGVAFPCKSIGGNSTSARMAGGYGSLSVIAKRSSTRCWTPNVTVARSSSSSAVRGLRERDNYHIVFHSEDGSAQRETLALAGPGGLMMMDKLEVPRLLSPSGMIGGARGEIVARLRGLQGRYEVSKVGQACSMVMLRKQPEESSAADQACIQHALAMYGEHESAGGATMGTFHASRVVKEVLEVPTSDSWLEEGNAQDRVLPPLVAELLRRVAEDGDRALEEDGCEIVPTTSKQAYQSAFHAQRRPKVSLADYAERMCKYGGCSPGCLALSLVYMDKFLKQTPGSRLTGLNVHRLLLSCTLVATKQWDDTHHNNAFWAKVGGIGNAELNSLERHLLAKLDYSLLVDKRDWDAYKSAIMAWGAARGEGARGGGGGAGGGESRAATSLPDAVSSREQFDALLALPCLRGSLVLRWARDTLNTGVHTHVLTHAGGNSNGVASRGVGGIPGGTALRETLDTSSVSHSSDLSASLPHAAAAAAAMSAYCENSSPEGPGSIMLSSDDSNRDDDGDETPGLGAEDIYMAAHRQMRGGMGQRKAGVDERCAKQMLTGGAGSRAGAIDCRV
jgi:hypothetical protein